MVKSEQEVQKVVKAMGYLFLHATFTTFSDPDSKTPEADFMKGCKARFTLKPGQSEQASELMSTEFIAAESVENYVPSNGQVTKTLQDFVLEFRKIFTSIHEFKKVLSIEMTKVPTADDMEWVKSVMDSYNVTPTKQYIVCTDLPGTDYCVIVDVGYGQQAIDCVDLWAKNNWFIPEVPGFESKASPVSEKDKLRPGLFFREI